MWIKVKTNNSVVIGDVLSYDSASQTWIPATSLNTPLGVARTNAKPYGDAGTEYVVEMVLQGQVLAKASRDIPDQGGELNVENGAVFVDNTADHCGIIAPNLIEQPARVAGDLVTIIIR